VAVIVEDPMWHEHAREALGRFIEKRLVKTIVDDMRRDCPVGKTGDLLASIRQKGNQVWVGSRKVSYWSDVEYGTKPHMIYPVHAKALRWESDGQVHFAKKVRHPGTKAQPFIRPNFYRYRTAVYY
jgi:hypothetical protein